MLAGVRFVTPRLVAAGVATLAGLALWLSFTAFLVPGAQYPPFLSPIAISYKAAITGTVLCWVFLTAEYVIAATNDPPQPAPIAWAVRLMAAALAVIIAAIAAKYHGGKTAPFTTASWIFIGQALTLGVAVLGRAFAARLRPGTGARAGGFALALVVAIGAGAGSALAGIGKAASDSVNAGARDAGILSSSAGGRCHSVPIAADGRPPAWLRAKVVCNSGPVNYDMYWLRDRWVLSALNEARAKDISSDADQCNKDGSFVGTWYRGSDSSATIGQLLCYSAHGRRFIEWGSRETDVYGVASARMSSRDLYHWWHQNSPDPSVSGL